MTTPNPEPVNQRDTIYCTTVSLTAIAMVLCGILRSVGVWPAVLGILTPVLANSLAAMSPVGIMLQIASRRLFRPRDVLICVTMTTLWAAMMITAFAMTRGN